ncbi:MAG TPA: hypothetical protein VJV78_38215 [Polyangiales bacterium]|nr:hypothetical protein [Polyangiales bacterium]
MPLHGIPPNAEIGLAAADSLYLVVAAPGSVTDDLGTTSLLSFGPDLEPHWLQPNALPNPDPRRTLAFEGSSALIAAMAGAHSRCTSALLLDAANYIDRTFQWHLTRAESGELYVSYGVGVARLMN